MFIEGKKTEGRGRDGIHKKREYLGDKLKGMGENYNSRIGGGLALNKGREGVPHPLGLEERGCLYRQRDL